MKALQLFFFVFLALLLFSSCGKEEAECSRDRDCESGHVCDEGVCMIEVECRTDSECDGEAICIGGECFDRVVGLPCAGDEECEDGLYCADNLPGGYCTMTCEVPDDCPTGSVCVIMGGEGMCLAVCESQDHCRDDYACSAGVCSLPCGSDADCGGGFVCVGGVCEGAGVGLPCSDVGECEGDLHCVLEDRGGYCTTDCSTDADCPVGSVCGEIFGEPSCLAACRADLDCGQGAVCQQGGCLPRCTEGDCEEGYFCSGSGICRLEGQANTTTIDLGQAAAETRLEFEVPAGTHSFTLMVQGSEEHTFMYTSLVDSSGTERITGTIDMGMMGADGLTEPHRTMARHEINTTQVPNTDFAGTEIIPGVWSFTFSGGPAQARVVLKYGGEEGGSVPINVFVAPNAFPGNPNASNLADDAHFQAVLEEFDHFFLDQAGVARGEIRFYDLPAEYTDIELDMMSGNMEYEEMFKRFGRDDGLNAFIVRSITMGFFGNIAGISGGIPGPPRTGLTRHSGIVIEVQDEPRYTGLTFTHEAGHFHGLFHLTEQSLFGGPEIHDVLSDTPECSTEPCTEAKRHLMWPTLEPNMELLSPASGMVIRANAGVD